MIGVVPKTKTRRFKGRVLKTKPNEPQAGDVVVDQSAKHDGNANLDCEIFAADGLGGGAWYPGSWCVMLEFASLRVAGDYPALVRLTERGVVPFDASTCTRARARVLASGLRRETHGT